MCTFLNETNRARKSQTFHNRRRTKQQQRLSEKYRFKNSYPLRFRIWCAFRDREKTEYKLDYHSVIRLSMETGRGGRERWDFPSIQYQYFGTPDGAGCGVCRVPCAVCLASSKGTRHINYSLQQHAVESPSRLLKFLLTNIYARSRGYIDDHKTQATKM